MRIDKTKSWFIPNKSDPFRVLSCTSSNIRIAKRAQRLAQSAVCDTIRACLPDPDDLPKTG